MAKVVFCNIAWMKLYSDITDNDQPKNGGAFVKENEVESGACRGCAR